MYARAADGAAQDGAASPIMLTTMSTSLHHRAIEHLGTRIVAGELPPGHDPGPEVLNGTMMETG